MRPKASDLTQSRLRSLLRYEPETGVFTWRKGRKFRVRDGAVAGYVTGGYRRIQVDGEEYLAHRLAWLYMTGAWPSDQVDHINGCRGDNQWRNLREATNVENSRNVGLFASNTSGISGVHYCKTSRRWIVRIGVHPNRINLGRYKDFFEACCARKSAEYRHFGEFARDAA